MGAAALRVGLRLRLRQAGHRERLLAGDADRERRGVLPGAESLLRRAGGRRPRQAGSAGLGPGRLARGQGPEEIPEGLELEFLPARSPELQPSERLWPLVNERVCNRLFEDLDELEEALAERCLALSDQPDLLRGHTRYHWWPEAA